MSLLWADLQHTHLQDNPRRDVSDTCTKWVTKVLCFFWDRFFIQWKSRNQVVFGSTITGSRQSTVKQVLAEVRGLHSHQPHYRPCDISFLMSPAATDDDRIFNDTTRCQGVSRVQDWLETWKPYFRQSLRRASAAASSPYFTAVASAPAPNHLPHLLVAAGHESGRLLSTLLPNNFGLHLHDSAFIHLHPPGPSISCSESE
jgi:hypothetical protein